MEGTYLEPQGSTGPCRVVGVLGNLGSPTCILTSLNLSPLATLSGLGFRV